MIRTRKAKPSYPLTPKLDLSKTKRDILDGDVNTRYGVDPGFRF